MSRYALVPFISILLLWENVRWKNKNIHLRKFSEAHKSDLVFYDMQTTNLHINVKKLENFNFQKEQFGSHQEKVIICFNVLKWNIRSIKWKRYAFILHHLYLQILTLTMIIEKCILSCFCHQTGGIWVPGYDMIRFSRDDYILL